MSATALPAPAARPRAAATHAAPVAPEALPELPLAELDEPGPVSVERVGRGGAWLVACEQTATPKLTLAIGSHAEPIDDLLGWDPTGRFVVVRRGGNVWLLDVITAVRSNLTALGFDDRDDTLDYRQHRALAFDPRGDLIAYVRAGKTPGVVLHTLRTGEERLVGVPGEVWRMGWEASGQTLVVSTVTEDTTGNGKLSFPVRLRRGPRQRCSGLLPHFHIAPEVGDRPSTVLVSRDGATVRPAPDFVIPFGGDYVSRRADGALGLERPSGRQPLADADCGARIVLADPMRNLLLVACTNDKARPRRTDLELVGPGYRQDLGVGIMSLALDRWPDAPTRLVPLYPGSAVVLLDLDERKLFPLDSGDRVLTTSGEHALVRRDDRLLWVDAASGKALSRLEKVDPLAGLVLEGSVVALGTTVVDATTGNVLGKLPGRPLALTPSGRALVPEGGWATAEAFARGPLRWHAPEPSSESPATRQSEPVASSTK